jgi:hypothetical protein
MARKALRAVSEDERPPAVPTKPKSIKQAAESSERDLLVSLRTLLASELDKGAVPAHALASVSAKLREYDREIRALDARDDERDGGSGVEVADGSFDASAV